ncbi:EAL domain-containing protein [Arenimonas sp.]|uniref:bifunctional diguanylate cyclase/phosphodiesterase n=1 Tax=Arenimonas sp. TaxID=1872635 RepID=UPI0035B46D47
MIVRTLTAWPARVTLPALLLVLSVAALAVQLFVILGRIDASARADVADDVSRIVWAQARRIDAQAEIGVRHGTARMVGGLAMEPRVAGAWVVDGEGRVLSSLHRRDIGKDFEAVLSGRPAAAREALVAAAYAGNSGRALFAGDSQAMALSQEVLVGTDPSRYAMLVVEADAGPVAAQLRHEAGRRFLRNAAGVLAFTTLLWLLLRAAWTERTRRLRDGAARLWLEGEALEIDVQGGDELAALAREIEKASARVRRQGRLLRTVSQASLAAQRLTDRSALGMEICRILVQEGGYTLAGLWRLQPDGHTLVQATLVGFDEATYRLPDADLDSPSDADRLSTRALLSGEVQVLHDLAAVANLHPALVPLRNLGLHSVAVVPLVEMGQKLGALILADRRPNRFDTDFLVAITSAAADISASFILREREQLARDAEHRLTAALNAAALGTWESHLGTGEMRVNARWFEMLGLDPRRDAEEAAAWRLRLHPDDVPRLERAYARLDDPAINQFEIDMRLRHANGHWASVHSRGMVLERDPQGRPLRLAGVHLDMTRLRQDEAQLRIAADAFANSHEGILICDGDGVIVSVNRAFERVTGYSPEEAVGRRPSMLSSGHQDKAFYQRMWEEIDQRGRWEGEVWNRRKSGEVYPEWLAITRIRHEGGRVNYLGQFIDISERKQVQSRIDELSRTDPLTGLPNRSAFGEVVARSLAGERPRLAVLLLNIDRFKQVNESLGYGTGDEVLQMLARRLAAVFGDGNTLARVSGDEFAVALPGAGEAEARAVVDRLQLDLQQPFEIAGQRLVLGLSAGLALSPEHGTEAELLLVSATAALNLSRSEGERRLAVYSPRQPGASLRRLTLESQLRLALQRRELFAVYQPQVALADGRLVGLEALVRWRHPERGVVSPGEFIPVAEEAGLITAIGDFMLRESCTAAARLYAGGLPRVPVSVNIATGQLRRADFLPQVLSELEASGLPPQLLEIEITESMLMADVQATIALLAALRERGVRVAIDDFGTGYSSLAYLGRLPLDRLKIDQSFVRDLRVPGPAEGIVRTVIELARSLHLNVLAEGVEQAEDAERLRSLGCNDAQGYLYDRPLPEAEVLAKYKA